MMKECFGLKTPSPEKFRECATCAISEPCVRTVYLGEAKCVDKLARFIGFALGAFGVVLALAKWSSIPNGAPWLLAVSALYIAAVQVASTEYAGENGADTAAAKDEAEHGPKKPAAEAHGHH